MLNLAGAFFRTTWLGKRLRTRKAVSRYQSVRLLQMMAAHRAAIPFYHDASPTRLDLWPVMDKATARSAFADLNRPAITLDVIQAALDRGQDYLAGHAIGQSTGTSGNRGYYVVSDQERFVWLGTLLAKTLPDIAWRKHRVALAMPGMSSLYRATNRTRRVDLRFFPLADGISAWQENFCAFDPDVVVAPPKVLRLLAEDGTLQARHIFSGAEVLDPLDRRVIEDRTGQVVREIYMATEGLFGVACRFGTLHLAEDVVHFEWEAIAGDSTLRIPVVTDFVRRAQAMVRYRMNDLVELSHTPCICGSPFQAVRRIEGRRDDMFEFPMSDGSLRRLTPDILRNTVVDADRRIDDFRILQTGPGQIAVHLPAPLDGAADAAVIAAMHAALARIGVTAAIQVQKGIETPFDRKLRRVMRVWKPN